MIRLIVLIFSLLACCQLSAQESRDGLSSKIEYSTNVGQPLPTDTLSPASLLNAPASKSNSSFPSDNREQDNHEGVLSQRKRE